MVLRVSRSLHASIAGTVIAAVAATATIAPAAAGETGPDPLTWDDCPAGSLTDDAAQCADIDVPKDYSDPSAGKITLTMSRIPATGERKGVIAGNPGGPGGDALGMFTSADADSAESEGKINLPPDVTEHYDLVAVEPRGLTWGTPLECGVPPALEANAGDILAGCEASDPGYAGTVTTDNTARDLDEARKALGEDTLNLYGVSYGGALMSTYATMFPEHTGRVLLDSSASPEQRWAGTGQQRKQARIDALNAMFRWLAARDDEYHLGTTPLQVYTRWADVVTGPYGVQLPTVPPAAQDEDLPGPAQSLPGELGARVMDSVVYAVWRSGTVVDSARTFLGDPLAAVGRQAGFMGLMNGVYDQNSWPLIGEQLRDPEGFTAEMQERAADQPRPSDEEVAAMQKQQVQSAYVERAVTCNENTVPGDRSLILPALETRYTGGDLVRYNEDMIGSGLFCDGWAPTTVPTSPNGDALDHAPLNIGYSHDTAVSPSGAPDMQKAMGGDLLTVDGYSHGVLLRDPQAFESEISDYFA